MSKQDDTYDSETCDSLSAFLDNEADAADIEALLAADMDVLASKVDRYHLIHQSLQPDSESLTLDSAEFLASIHHKLEQEVSDSNVVAFPGQNMAPAPRPRPETLEAPQATAPLKRGRSLFAGLAVAASMAFVVVLGGNLLLEGESSVAPSTYATTFVDEATPQVVQPVNQISIEQALQDNARLQNYLRQHAQQASMSAGQGMIPMAKVVSYPQGNQQ